MKTKSIYSKICLLAAVAFTIIALSSCKKNDLNSSESFDIKVVNASQNSGTQTFTLAGQFLVGGLNYGDASSYITTTSGTRLIAEFKNESGGAGTATGELYTDNGVRFTTYLVGEGASRKVKSFKDNLSLPASGRARVKFVHLSDAAPSDINIRNSSGDNLVTNISRYTDSGYQDINPGTLSLRLVGTALRNTVGNFEVTGLEAGKIYSIYLTGSTDATLNVQKVTHN